jgi:hypothetical protein
MFQLTIKHYPFQGPKYIQIEILVWNHLATLGSFSTHKQRILSRLYQQHWSDFLKNFIPKNLLAGFEPVECATPGPVRFFATPRSRDHRRLLHFRSISKSSYHSMETELSNELKVLFRRLASEGECLFAAGLTDCILSKNSNLGKF